MENGLRARLKKMKEWLSHVPSPMIPPLMHIVCKSIRLSCRIMHATTHQQSPASQRKPYAFSVHYAKYALRARLPMRVSAFIFVEKNRRKETNIWSNIYAFPLWDGYIGHVMCVLLHFIIADDALWMSIVDSSVQCTHMRFSFLSLSIFLLTNKVNIQYIKLFEQKSLLLIVLSLFIYYFLLFFFFNFIYVSLAFDFP